MGGGEKLIKRQGNLDIFTLLAGTIFILSLDYQSQKENEAITRYRVCLRSVDSFASSPLRLTFARQLAEVLLRRACQVNKFNLLINCLFL